MTTAGILDHNGIYYSDINQINDVNGILKRYHQLQYNNMFDKKHLVYEMYEVRTHKGGTEE